MRSLIVASAVLTCVATFGPLAFAQSVYYVNAAAEPGGDGLSWATAFQHPQPALDTNPAGLVEIWIAAGTYYPIVRTDPTDPKSAVFPMRNAHALYGGFAGDETDKSQRDPAAHPTVFSGDLGVLNDPVDNAYHVVKSSNNDRRCILDSVTVRDADGGPIVDRGGGLLAETSYMQIRNCVFERNTAQYEGAAMYIRGGGGMTLIDVVVRENVGVTVGGAVSINGARTLLVRCQFENNQGGTGGGALRIQNGSGEIIDCSFTGNHAGIGAGLYADGTRHLIVTGCTFDHNVAESGGGAIQISAFGETVLDRCTIVDNTAVLGDAGGVALSTGEPSWVRNCLIARNTAGRNGGGIFGNFHGGGVFGSLITDNHAVRGGGVYINPWESTIVLASTIYGNSAEEIGGGFFNAGQPLDCQPVGSIFWGNTDSTGQGGEAQISTSYGTPVLNSCCVQGLPGTWYGFNNIGEDPLFVDPAGGDFGLNPGSPCIDAGNNPAIPEENVLDFMREPRFVDDPNSPDNGFGTPPLIDMGAIEFQASGRAFVLSITGDCPSGGVQLISWAGARPGSQVVLLYSGALGQVFIPPGSPCAGTALGLGADHLTVVLNQTSDSEGKRIVPIHAPRAACGGWLQAVELRRCRTSNVAPLN